MIPLVFHPIYSQLPLPPKHRFPIEKYQGIKDQLLANGVSENAFLTPEAIPLEDLKVAHSAKYVDSFIDGTISQKAIRRLGMPWSQQFVKRTLHAVGGTVLTSKLALEHGLALNLTGGYHHAFSDFGSGFCVFNDIVLSATHMLKQEGIDKVLTFDCDVHQGDGTALLASGNDAIYTVSLHCEKNFPARKQHSDLDFPLERGMTDDEYLYTVECALQLAFNSASPDAVIYDAGVDIHESDDLGYLNITTKGVFERDKLVFDACKRHGVPVAAVIGGGYQRNIDDLVNVHLQLYRAAGVVK
ncbi:histone deacetylase/AcuC/AphA family protein [Glaciecola punicea ACAM 611]|jgi:acetoin utilization deacetylase AcuC-like enzyme|uniref:Histone deacetylase/AcuC/AphA family protein n=1 Tax=Glaciecola punicea ACAM 611 TaxID=1121923 RepID=H5T8C9_9ALTE|nr:histone deacetylase [Glaciecola punicea]OFA30546.1 histone deacetylase [Glaciecola punicea]GAB54570.1 histone deacetylase/AcuC/AphA family protein [Glaciecola punicea ACAM 611]